MRADALRERLAAAGQLVRWPDGVPVEIAAVTTNSRTVAPGGLFVAYAGSTVDGHAFLPAAEHEGVVCAVVERRVGGVAIPQIEVHNGRHAAAIAASLHFGDPVYGLELVAVTGTNGKTTTAHLLRHVFGDRAPAGSIGTLGAIDGGGRMLPDTGQLTTPGPVELQAALAALRESGCKTVAIEASSHSLDQDRIYGLAFRAAVYTNLTRDHLDYHKDEASYLGAKLKLSSYLAVGGFEITNADDPAWQRLPPRPERLTFGIDLPADVRASAIEGDAKGMRFTMTARGKFAQVALPLLGRFNVENALGAAAAAIALGRDVEEVGARLGLTPQVLGRMERVAEAPCVVLRDYAHTPDALERALAAARPLTGGRLLVVFGCGGDRDRGKRPVMGAIAAKGAHLAILTSDNPRTESPERILDDVEEGMGDAPHLRIVDRREAIARAISIARPDDTILLAGKGHEIYQVLGTERVPFDEREVVAEAVQTLAR
ncbi:MAG: UDP-N-acetylmuramoyl-L-alanyl-D-glutamate--2,6-diaminopimelate ligase [Gemmatimonadetes bacterium]|nr:UDP-N-acetylmuramoyl-L-alanyl-D-glutamate--2,6-diaminopimelate ligase [Gemmatimonadota bacterium]